MSEKHKLIRDFCDWLRGQGCAYEMIYYGTSKDVDKLIEKYLGDGE